MVVQDVRERGEILNLSHAECLPEQAVAGWAPVPGILSATPVSKSHEENQNSGWAGVGVGPGNAKRRGTRRRSRRSVAATRGSGEAL